MQLDVWVSKAIRVSIDTFADFLEWSGASESLGGLLPELRQLPGFPLETRSRLTTGGHLYETEVRYLVHDEWAVDPDDVLWRRTKEGLHMTVAQRAEFARWMAELRPNFT